MRRIFNADQQPSDYGVEGRRRNAERIVEVCLWLDRQGFDVVCAILCIFPDLLEANRQRFSGYFEVFVDTPLETVAQRDIKSLYAPAIAGELRDVVGVDIEFPRPGAPDLTVDNGADGPFAGQHADAIIAGLRTVEARRG